MTCKALAFSLLLACVSSAAIPTADTVTNFAGLKFKRIPAGSFQMGYEGRRLNPATAYEVYGDSLLYGFYNEFPQHKVTFTLPFYMGVAEVTQSQYAQYKNGSPTGSLPANANWFDADSFCGWLTAHDPDGYQYRLPTEAEWEYCCRAGTATFFSTGDTLLASQANFMNQGYYAQLTAAGTYPPNPWGLYDMHGNAHEWCLDWVGPYSPDSAVDPGGAVRGDFRAVRGNSGHVMLMRSATRSGLVPFSGSGFRVVMSELTPESLAYSALQDTQPYQRNVSASRPAPLTIVSGENYQDQEGNAFKRVRMGRAGYPTQTDSVLYVSLLPIQGDSGTLRRPASAYAKRLSETYGVLYRLSNRYERLNAGVDVNADHYFLTILPDMKYLPGRPNPDVAYYRRTTTKAIVEGPLSNGPLYRNVNHSAYVGECPNGDLLLAWFSGMTEDASEQTEACSRLRFGDTAWDAVSSLFHDTPGFYDGMSPFWNNGKGILYNFPNGWLRKSTDNGVSWSAWNSPGPGWGMAGKGVYRLGGDTIIGHQEGDRGCLLISVDGGENWASSGPILSGIHPTGFAADDGVIYCYKRGATVDNGSGTPTMQCGITANRGASWTTQSTPFLPQNIGQFDVSIKLHSGRMLMACVSEGSVCIAESIDSAKTWFCRRKLGSDVGCGYKDMVQTKDGMIHLVGTWGSGTGAGDNWHVAFNEAWLREGACLDVASWGVNTPERLSPCPAEEAEDSSALTTLKVACDDNCELYFNGIYIGQSSGWGLQEFSLYRSEENIIAVKCHNGASVAGFLSEIIAGDSVYGTSAGWKASLNGPSGWTDPGFDDAGWAGATELGVPGMAPWGPISGLSPTTPAKWIWWSTTATNQDVYFRYEFALPATMAAGRVGANNYSPLQITAAPNPFNPTALISFTVDKVSQASVAIYDIRGKRVKVLFTGEVALGVNRVALDGVGMASGVYLVRLITGSTVLEKRITLIR